VPLSLKVKLLNLFRVINCLGIDLLVSNNNALPDGLISLLEVELKEFAVFNTPERVFDLDFLAELTLKEGFLALETTGDVLGLNLNI
jgi:hypothetical protein